MVADDEAEGKLAQLFAAARRRAGKVFNILRIQSLEPDVLRDSTRLYISVMHADGALDRFTREALGVIVSRANSCHY